MAITEEEKNQLLLNRDKVECTPKKKLPKWAKVTLIVTGGLVGTLLLAWLSANLLKYPIYADYYSRQTDLYEIPGLNEGKVPQGCAYDDVNKTVYTTSYASNGSFVYATNDNGSIAHPLKKNGEVYTGHAGGISTYGDYAFIACDDYIYTIKVADLLNKDVYEIDIGNGVKVNNQASFTYADENYLYVGEFNNDGQYVTEHPVGNNKAIITRYNVHDFDLGSTTATPNRIISIPNEVQGACFFKDGTMVLCTSWALNSSKFMVYEPTSFKETDTEIDGVKVEELVKDARIIKAPMMMEDLDVYEDENGEQRLITLTESACNKYILGKFLFYTKIITVKVN